MRICTLYLSNAILQDGVSYECQFNNKTIGATADTMTGTANPGNELELQKAVATVAPISVIIDAAHIGFQVEYRLARSTGKSSLASHEDM